MTFLDAMTSTDPLAVNAAAHDAGIVYATLKREAADMEAGRKDVQLKIRNEYIAAGENKTNAEDKARTSPGYLEYVRECDDLAQRRDEAEVTWKVLYQRAWLLARTSPEAI